VDDDVAALGAEGHLDRIGQGVDAAQHLVACVARELDFLGSHVCWLLEKVLKRKGGRASLQPGRTGRPESDGDRQPSITPMMSDSFMISRSSPLSLTSVPLHLPNSTRSPALTSSALILPL